MHAVIFFQAEDGIRDQAADGLEPDYPGDQRRVFLFDKAAVAQSERGVRQYQVSLCRRRRRERTACVTMGIIL